MSLQEPNRRAVLHWYDFLCPFCYVGQQRSAILQRHGLEVVDLPFQAHPEIPPGGSAVGPRNGPMYVRIEAEAKAAGLPIAWPPRLPDTRMALAAAEWARRHAPGTFSQFHKALFAAHFALGEDIGDANVVDRHARECGIALDDMHAALEGGVAYGFVDESETLARSLGVRGTPAWFAEGRLLPGLLPREEFEAWGRALADDR
jgi:predicted DsbA family dithiol-disulfide isomerase